MFNSFFSLIFHYHLTPSLSSTFFTHVSNLNQKCIYGKENCKKKTNGPIENYEDKKLVKLCVKSNNRRSTANLHQHRHPMEMSLLVSLGTIQCKINDYSYWNPNNRSMGRNNFNLRVEIKSTSTWGFEHLLRWLSISI